MHGDVIETFLGHHRISEAILLKSYRNTGDNGRTQRKAMIRRAKMDASWQLDPDKPWYHVMPRSGWLNDPNGPIFYKEKYHV